MEKRFYCPVNGWDCPYWKEGGVCGMGDGGLNPMQECDDFAGFWDPEDEYWEEVEE